MLDYHVTARRIDSHGSEATTKDARIVLDTDLVGTISRKVCRTEKTYEAPRFRHLSARIDYAERSAMKIQTRELLDLLRERARATDRHPLC